MVVVAGGQLSRPDGRRDPSRSVAFPVVYLLNTTTAITSYRRAIRIRSWPQPAWMVAAVVVVSDEGLPACLPSQAGGEEEVWCCLASRVLRVLVRRRYRTAICRNASFWPPAAYAYLGCLRPLCPAYLAAAGRGIWNHSLAIRVPLPPVIWSGQGGERRPGKQERARSGRRRCAWEGGTGRPGWHSCFCSSFRNMLFFLLSNLRLPCVRHGMTRIHRDPGGHGLGVPTPRAARHNVLPISDRQPCCGAAARSKGGGQQQIDPPPRALPIDTAACSIGWRPLIPGTGDLIRF